MSTIPSLEALLAEDAESVRARRLQLFDRLAADSSGIVLVGAGGLGKRVLSVLRHAQAKVLAFCDNQPSAQGKSIDGLPVLSLAEAAKQFPHAAFVLTIFNPQHGPGPILRQLRELGCRPQMIVPLAWKYADALLPIYFLDVPEKIIADQASVRAAFDLLDDEESRREYVEQLAWRLSGEIEAAPIPAGHPQYFPADLFALQPDEVFVDCGAYDGDTCTAFLEQSGRRFRHLAAFEPDPANFRKLQQLIAAEAPSIRQLIRAKAIATGKESGTVRFSANGLPSAAIDAHGEIEVPVGPLDELLHEAPTYIKMDIEGAELDALAGAQKLIAAHRPILAIRAYHAQDHLWRVPLAMAALVPSYRLFLRRYSEWQFDTVCYAVPPERLKKNT